MGLTTGRTGLFGRVEVDRTRLGATRSDEFQKSERMKVQRSRLRFGPNLRPAAPVGPNALSGRSCQRADPPRNISSENPASSGVGDEVLRIGRALRTR